MKTKEAAPTQVTKEPPVPGFSAGTSRPAPPPPQNKQGLIAAALASVALLGAVTAFVVSSGGDGDSETADPPLESVATNVPTTVAASVSPLPGGDGAVASEVVRVVDHGWYVHEDRLGSYAFVIENTSDQKLGPFLVRVTGYDRDDVMVSGVEPWKHLVGMMQPHQRVGIADQLDTVAQADDGITRLEFEVVEVSSDPVEGVPMPDSIPDGEIVVSNVKVVPGARRSVVSYDATSTFAGAYEGEAYVVMRDAAGRIVGGANSFVDLPGNQVIPHDFEFDALSVPADAADMEVYVVPSLAFGYRKTP